MLDDWLVVQIRLQNVKKRSNNTNRFCIVICVNKRRLSFSLSSLQSMYEIIHS
jgi:hypothetical protein